MRDETRALLLREADFREAEADRLAEAAGRALDDGMKLEEAAFRLRREAEALRADAEARPTVQEIKLTFDSSFLRAEMERFTAGLRSKSAFARAPGERFDGL